MNLTLKRTPGVYLVGFMGSGKTTVGRSLADRLGWPFADLDDDIEAAAGRTIPEVFQQDGEAEFRARETAALRKRVRAVQSGHPLVLALGGGAFAELVNAELLRGNGFSIWLDCPLELAWKRVEQFTHRPLARDRGRFEELFHQRRAAYAGASYRIAVTGDDDAVVVEEILSLPFFV